jgi:hypothetical protein
MLDLQREIDYVRNLPGWGDRLANALQRIETGVNGIATNLGGDPTQTVTAPPTIQGLSVKTDGAGNVHAVVSDNNPIQRNLHYFLEYSTDPSFPQPHVVHLGATRTMNPIALPANDDNGKPQKFYFRAYSQYPGGHPGQPIHFGGTTPSPVSPGGSAKMTLLPSTGSGTAPSDGQTGGSGFGKILFRGPITPKRSSG